MCYQQGDPGSINHPGNTVSCLLSLSESPKCYGCASFSTDFGILQLGLILSHLHWNFLVTDSPTSFYHRDTHTAVDVALCWALCIHHVTLLLRGKYTVGSTLKDLVPTKTEQLVQFLPLKSSGAAILAHGLSTPEHMLLTTKPAPLELHCAHRSPGERD